MTVEIVTDCYGSEIEWNITEDGGTEILASGVTYPNITGGETYPMRCLIQVYAMCSRLRISMVMVYTKSMDMHGGWLI